MQRKKMNATNRSIRLFESQIVSKIALKYQTFLQFDLQSNWDRASQAIFERFSLFYKCEAHRKIIEKPYAAKKKGRDEFYPEHGRGKEHSFF